MLECYSKQWIMGDAFTVLKRDNGELWQGWGTKFIVKLPCGDILNLHDNDGDYHFSGINKVLRSSDGGETWIEDKSKFPKGWFVFWNLGKGKVRLYGRYSFVVKDSCPRKYIFQYCDSIDGGKSFSKTEYGYYWPSEFENPNPLKISNLMGPYALPEKITNYEGLLTEAGWNKEEWQNAELGELGFDDVFYKRNDGSLLYFMPSNLADFGDPLKHSQSMTVIVSEDGGINWKHLSVVAPYIKNNHENGIYEASHAILNDGRIYVVMRAGGGGSPLLHAWSSDNGKTWTKPEYINEKVTGVAPTVIKLSDGALAMTYGRPGMFLMFDHTGTGKNWDVENRFDIYSAEELTVKTNAVPNTSRKDIKEYMSVIPIPKEKLWWMRKDLLNGNYLSWENIELDEIEAGRLRVKYDLQSWVEFPGAKPLKAIRGLDFIKNHII